MDSEQKWQMVLERRSERDGEFYYGVRTTGVYCRPGCPSRRPRRESVEFFDDTEAAERAGYRACRRCHPGEAGGQERALEQARRLLEECGGESGLTLAELGRQVGLSPFHLQRVFKQRMGMSPHQYQQALRMERFRQQARRQASVTDALYEAGFGSGSRLYEAAATRLGMTPGEYRRRGRGITIRYEVFPSALGQVLIAATGRGLCSLRLGEDGEALVAELRSEFQDAELIADAAALTAYREALLAYLDGDETPLDLPLDLRATAFQTRIWQLLRQIPRGETRSYQQLAEAAGSPRAVRAVGSACASNPVALVIPCHRALRKSGELAGYRWGLQRKQALLEMEQKTVKSEK